MMLIIQRIKLVILFCIVILIASCNRENKEVNISKNADDSLMKYEDSLSGHDDSKDKIQDDKNKIIDSPPSFYMHQNGFYNSDDNNDKTKHIISEKKYNDYRFIAYAISDDPDWPNKDSLFFEIYQADSMVFAINNVDENSIFRIYMRARLFDISGKDITNSGNKNVVLELHTGGKCCYLYFIFELSDSLSIIDIIDAQYSYLEFVDLDNDGKYEIIMLDLTYTYWACANYCSPVPKVVFEYDNTYSFSERFMKSRALNENKLSMVKKEIKKNKINPDYGCYLNYFEIDVLIMKTMLDLVYSGKTDEALLFLKETWPRKNKKMNEFLMEVFSMMIGSPYYEGINMINSKQKQFQERI